MSYRWIDMNISIFDAHTILGLTNSNANLSLFKSPFTVLEHREKFNQLFADYYSAKQQKDRVSLKAFRYASQHLEFFPLFSQNNRFWKDYICILGDDYWKAQMPLVCTDIRASLDSNLGRPESIFVKKPSLYLSKLGWSSCINVLVRGGCGQNEFIQLLHKLLARSNNPQEKPFRLNGEQVDLVTLFQYIQKLVLEEVFNFSEENFRKSGHLLSMPLNRYILVSAIRHRGNITPWESMSTAQKALMLSILLHKDIHESRVGALLVDPKQKILNTTITTSGENFALSRLYKAYGNTFIFLQKQTLVTDSQHRHKAKHYDDHDDTEGVSIDRKMNAPACVHNNIQAMLRMFFLLKDWQKYFTTHQPSSEDDLEKKENINRLLQEIPAFYKNQFCHHWFLAMNSPLPTPLDIRGMV